MVHEDRGKIVVILLVPAKTQQRHELRTLVDDGRMFQTSQVEHANRTVGSDTGKYVLGRRKGNIVHLLIMGNELCTRLLSLDVPYRAGRIDAGGADQCRVRLVPVERCQRGTKLTVLVLQTTLEKMSMRLIKMSYVHYSKDTEA